MSAQPGTTNTIHHHVHTRDNKFLKHQVHHHRHGRDLSPGRVRAEERIVFEEERPRRHVLGEGYTKHTGRNVEPIYSTTRRDGTTITVFEDYGSAKLNPLAEIFLAAQRGDPIRNEHLENVFSRSIQILEREKKTGRLNPHGLALATDLELIFMSMEKLLHEKNKEGRLQALITSSFGAFRGNANVMRGPPGAAPLVGPMKELAMQLRQLVMLMVRSPDFRTIGLDIINLSKDILAQHGGGAAQQQFPVASYTTYGTTDLRSSFGTTTMEPMVTSVGGAPSYVGRSYVTESYIPTGISSIGSQPQQPVSQELIDKFTSILQRLSTKDEYKTAVRSIYSIVDTWGQQLQQRKPTDTTHIREASDEGVRFLEALVGRDVVNNLRMHLTSLYQDVRADPQLQGYFTEMRNFILRVMDEPTFLEGEEGKQTASTLLNRGSSLVNRVEWRDRFKQLLQDFKQVFSSFTGDEYTGDLMYKFQKLMRDMSFNADGRPDLFVMDQSMRQMKFLILALIRCHFENIPIDRVEVTGPRVDMVIEDILIHAPDILPDYLLLEVKNDMVVNMQEMGMDERVFKVKMAITHIKPELRNITYWLKHKAFPAITDYGLVDVVLWGSGISVYIDWRFVHIPGAPAQLQLSHVATAVADLDIRFHRAHHQLLDNFAVGLLKNRIRKAIADGITGAVYSRLMLINEQVNKLFHHKAKGMVYQKLDTALKQRYDSSKAKQWLEEREQRKKQKEERPIRTEGSYYTMSQGPTYATIRPTVMTTSLPPYTSYTTTTTIPTVQTGKAPVQTMPATGVPTMMQTRMPTTGLQTSMPTGVPTAMPGMQTAPMQTTSYAVPTPPPMPSGLYYGEPLAQNLNVSTGPSVLVKETETFAVGRGARAPLNQPIGLRTTTAV